MFLLAFPLVSWETRAQETKVFDADGRDCSFSAARLPKKPEHGASLTSLAIGSKKRAKEMS
jgi:hypothetical protein